jgi:hypothetical protein
MLLLVLFISFGTMEGHVDIYQNTKDKTTI